jgi:hypothetical protein
MLQPCLGKVATAFARFYLCVYEQVVTGHTNGGIGECTLTGACAEARLMPVLRI